MIVFQKTNKQCTQAAQTQVKCGSLANQSWQRQQWVGSDQRAEFKIWYEKPRRVNQLKVTYFGPTALWILMKKQGCELYLLWQVNTHCYLLTLAIPQMSSRGGNPEALAASGFQLDMMTTHQQQPSPLMHPPTKFPRGLQACTWQPCVKKQNCE